MTILQKIENKLLWARRITFLGGLVFFMGIIYSFASVASNTAELIIYIGIAIIVLGWFYGFNFISCPRCAHNLGKDAFFQSNIGFRFKNELKECPFCKLSMSKQSNESLI